MVQEEYFNFLFKIPTNKVKSQLSAILDDKDTGNGWK